MATTQPGARAVLVVNAGSRRGESWFSLADAKLRSLGVPLEGSWIESDAHHVALRVERAVNQGVDTVIVGGGDGTVSAVARHLIGSQATLGLLPLGTGNALARDLEIVSDVDRACEVICGGKCAKIDLGTIEDDFFVNIVSVGITTRIAENLDPASKRRYGRLAYFAAVIKALTRMRPFEAKLELNDGRHELRTMLVVIGNGRFHAGPFPLAPEATIMDGVLSVYALASDRKAAFFRLAWHLRTGRHVDMDEVSAFTSTWGRLTTHRPRRVNVDGEVSLRTPVEFGLAPRALQVLVPESFDIEAMSNARPMEGHASSGPNAASPSGS